MSARDFDAVAIPNIPLANVESCEDCDDYETVTNANNITQNNHKLTTSHKRQSRNNASSVDELNNLVGDNKL
jgi:hypothetical protein